MAVDGNNVRITPAGAIYVGAVGTTAPTDASTALNAAFKDLGGISQNDNVVETRDRSTTPIKFWATGATARTIVTESSLTYTFTMIETTKLTVETFYGTTLSSLSLVVNPANTGGRKAWAMDVIDGTNLFRVHIPEGEITEVGDVTYSNEEERAYPVTLEAYYNSGIAGNAKLFWSSLAS